MKCRWQCRWYTKHDTVGSYFFILHRARGWVHCLHQTYWWGSAKWFWGSLANCLLMWSRHSLSLTRQTHRHTVKEKKIISLDDFQTHHVQFKKIIVIIQTVRYRSLTLAVMNMRLFSTIVVARGEPHPSPRSQRLLLTITISRSCASSSSSPLPPSSGRRAAGLKSTSSTLFIQGRR